MANVAECLGKLVAARAISQAVGDEAMNMFQRSQEQYSKQMGPASSDAAAALQAAKELRERAADKQLAIAHGVKAWRATERRVIEDPRGGMLQINAMNSKDTLLGVPALNELRRKDPHHPIFTGGNVDEIAKQTRNHLYNIFRANGELDKFKAGGPFADGKDLIREVKGVDTGNKAARAVALGWKDMVEQGERLAHQVGRQFETNEHWDTPQGWTSRRAAKFS